MTNPYAEAMQLRDQIRQIVREEVQRQAPAPSYATIYSIDAASGFCLVVFPGENTPVRATFGAFRPRQPGQIVRIEGPPGNRYIADILGDTQVHKDLSDVRFDFYLGEKIIWGSGNPSGVANQNSIYVDTSNNQRVRIWRYNNGWSLVNQADLAPQMNVINIRRNTSQSIGNAPNPAVQIAFNTTDHDIRSSGVSSQRNGSAIICREAGLYYVDVFLAWASNSNGTRECFLRLNGVNQAWSTLIPAGPWCAHSFGRLIWMNVNDQLTVHVWQNSGGSLPIDNGAFGGDTWPRLSAHMLYRA